MDPLKTDEIEGSPWIDDDEVLQASDALIGKSLPILFKTNQFTRHLTYDCRCYKTIQRITKR